MAQCSGSRKPGSVSSVIVADGGSEAAAALLTGAGGAVRLQLTPPISHNSLSPVEIDWAAETVGDCDKAALVSRSTVIV